jgi:hypothetical protein
VAQQHSAWTEAGHAKTAASAMNKTDRVIEVLLLIRRKSRKKALMCPPWL